MNLTARILRIEKISPNDGYGLRTVVFFKGCPLRCGWCSTGALSVYGMEMTVAQVMKQILKDEVFYFHSGGGVTLSGGDVLLQAEFAAELLEECRDNGIHTMAELDMYGDFSKVELLLPHLSALFVDIKHMNPQQHKQWTGVDNAKILKNIRKTAAYYKARNKKNAIHFRIPLIWDMNDSPENILETARFCQDTGVCAELEFLPYHRLGESTYGYLDRTYGFAGKPKMSFEDAYQRVKVLKGEQLSFPVKISGKEIF